MEPHAHDALGSNTARTNLLTDGEPLPWAEWAAEFRNLMPDEIKALMEEITAGSSATNHKQAIRERLKQIRDLLRNPSRYRRNPSGGLTVSGEAPGGQTKARDTIADSSGRSGGSGGRAGSIYALFVDEDGEPGNEVVVDPMPDVMWVSQSDTPPTRTSDLLEDRAAKYLPSQNLLQINADFRVFTDMVDRWCESYSYVPGARSTVEEVVHEWFEQALVETVIGAQALQGSPEWTMEDVGNLWSEEALTAAALQRYHIDINIKRVLGSKLGSIATKEAVAA